MINDNLSGVINHLRQSSFAMTDLCRSVGVPCIVEINRPVITTGQVNGWRTVKPADKATITFTVGN